MSKFQNAVTVMKAGTSEYYNNARAKSTLSLQFPAAGTTQRKVQSIFIGRSVVNGAASLSPVQNLVDIFVH